MSAPALDLGGPEGPWASEYGDAWLELPVFARFEAMACRNGEALATRDEKGTLSYEALLEKSMAIGAFLATTLPPGDPVAIAVPVDRFTPAAMLGSLAAGRPYVPLDLAFPPERVRHILTHSGARVVLVTQATRALVEPLLPAGVRCVDVERLPGPGSWRPEGGPDDGAYILYTSGSTGSPKGVLQDQRGLTHDILQYARSAHLAPGDVLTGIYSPCVNGALRDIYGALLNGATLGVLDLRRQGLGAVATSIREWGVTVYHSMPPILRSFLRLAARPEDLAGIRLAYVAGDRFFARDLTQFRQVFPPAAHLLTGIGSTECATLYCQWFVPPGWPEEDPLPVGRAVPGRHLELLDGQDRPVPAGEPGEIHVSCPFLARGYWREEGQTRERFKAHPTDPSRRRYRTGDLGRLGPNGLLTFLGRADRQVKIRGFRVEPAEAEAALRAQPGVLDAALVVRRGEGEPTLAAYVSLAKGTDEDALRSRMEQILPAHLCPSEIIVLSEWPTLGNFKVDQGALEALDKERRFSPEAPGPMAGIDLPGRIREVWQGILRRIPVRDDLSFREAGGDSLSALELHLALERALGTSLPAAWFGPGTTPAFLAEALRETRDPAAPSRGPRILILPGSGGANILVRQAADALAPPFEAHLLDYPVQERNLPGSMSIPDLAESCLPSIVERLAEERPLVLLGFSYGGRVALEAAVLLQEAGRRVDLLVIVDIPLVSHRMPLLPEPGGRPMWFRRARRGLSRLIEFLDPILPIAALVGMHRLAQGLSGGTARRLKWALSIIFVRCRIRRWRPSSWEGPTCLLVTDETSRACADLSPGLGWERHCRRLAVERIEGSHLDIFHPRQAPALIRILGVSLEAAAGRKDS